MTDKSTKPGYDEGEEDDLSDIHIGTFYSERIAKLEAEITRLKQVITDITATAKAAALDQVREAGAEVEKFYSLGRITSESFKSKEFAKQSLISAGIIKKRGRPKKKKV